MSRNNKSINININDLNLYNAMDYNYEYHYLKKEKFDLGSALANVGAAVAVGAMFPGAGAAAMAGAASSMGASQMTKGSVDIKMNYDETTIGNNLKGNNINISTGNNATLISANIDATNNINLDIGNELLIGSAEEKHQSFSKHETWGGDIGMAALGGAMTGLVSGLGAQAGAWMGDFLTESLNSLCLLGNTTTIAGLEFAGGSMTGAITGTVMAGASGFGASNVGAVISENLKGTSNGTYTTNQIGSDIVALNNINITTNNNLNIIGSDLTSLNNTTLTSNNGSVNILAAIETQITEESKTKTNWGGVDFTHTNSSVGVGASVERNTTSNTTTTQYAKSSNIQSGNNITISSGNDNSDNVSRQDINIIGSNIIAENDIKLNADNGDINVVSQELLQDVLDRQKTETITASVGISNTFAKTAMDIADGINQHNGYDNNAEGYTSLATNLAFDSLNNLLTLGTLGFGASATISYTNTEITTTQNNTYNQGSAIISNKGNIELTAENDINIKGSTIATNGENKEINLTSDNGDINITASKNTINMNSNTDSDTISVGGGIGLTGPTGLYAGYDKSKSDTNTYGTSYNNSVISNTNGTINIKTENTSDKENNGNVLVSGANIEGKDINIDVVNNLTVESLQDTYYSKTETNNYGGTAGTSLGSLSTNYTDGYNKTDSKWVNNQTSIIGNNSVNITTNNNTDLKGAVIASGSYDENGNFIDNNNLTLSTNSLTYSNIYDTDTSKSQNIGGGIGSTVSFNYSNGGHDKEQTTKATIGNGSIVIAGNEVSQENNNLNLVRDLNRDVNNSQKITKDESTGGWNVDVSVNIGKLAELVDKGFSEFTKEQIGELKENTKELINKIEQAKSFTKEQYNNLKKLFTKQNEELKVYYGELKAQLAAAKPGSPEYKEAEMKVGEAERMMEMSSEGIDLLIKLEGLETEVYKDTAGIDTIGIGHVIKKNEDYLRSGINEIDAVIILLDDIQKFERGVNKQVNVNLTQNEFDALVIFAFNIGLGKKGDDRGFYNSTIRKMINDDNYKSNKYKTKEDAWKAFNKSGGKVDKGLKNRRATEYNLFKNNKYEVIRSK